MKERITKETGITLIALVITIIIMLILVAVAISMITDKESIFASAEEAREKYNTASKNEVSDLYNLLSAVGQIDTLAPITATLEVVADTITTTGFTLKATGADATATDTSAASGIAKYEFYIKNENGEFVLEKTIESTNTTETYAVSGKTEGTEYTYKVIVYDAAGNSKTSAEINVQTVAIIIGNIQATYIGTRTFDIALTVESGEDKITEIEYFVDGVSKSKSTEQTYTSEEFEPESTHTVYAILYSNTGKGYKTNKLTIVTEPRTYLYKEGEEFTDVTGGLVSRVRSTNAYYTSTKTYFDGNGSHSNGYATKYSDYIMIAAAHVGSSGYGQTLASIETANHIVYDNYIRLYVNITFSRTGLAWIRVADGDTQLYTTDQGGSFFFDITNLTGARKLNLGVASTSTTGTSGYLRVNEIWLEK